MQELRADAGRRGLRRHAEEGGAPPPASSRSWSATWAASADSSKLPDAIFVIDTKKEHIAVTEARKLGLPVIAVVDTNCDPDVIDLRDPGQRRRHPLGHPDLPASSPTPSPRVGSSPRTAPSAGPRRRWPEHRRPAQPPVSERPRRPRSTRSRRGAGGGLRMPAFTAKDVQRLRQATGVGILDAKTGARGERRRRRGRHPLAPRRRGHGQGQAGRSRATQGAVAVVVARTAWPPSSSCGARRTSSPSRTTSSLWSTSWPPWWPPRARTRSRSWRTRWSGWAPR